VKYLLVPWYFYQEKCQFVISFKCIYEEQKHP
jgi:hypothetical protein